MTDFNESLRSFDTYENGSLFDVLNYMTQLQSRLRQVDMEAFQRIMGECSLNPDDCEEDQQRVENMVRILRPYGRDLVDRFDVFAKGYRDVVGSATSLIR